MADQVTDAFIRHLAAVTAEDPEKGKRLLAQVRLDALNVVPEEAFEAPIRTLAQYLSDPVEVPPVLVDPYIVVRGGVDGLIGRAGKGKTVLAMNRSLKWAAGKPLFDDWTDGDGKAYLMPSKPLRILIIENEGAGGLFHRQLGIMLNAQGYLDDEDRKLAKENILIWGDGGYSGLKLDDPAKLRLVREGCEKWEPDIVFVEPFRGLWNGEENSATDMAIVVDAMVEIAADFNCGVMVSHHERKSGVGEDGEKMSAGRGSTVLEGAVTVMENFEAVKGGQFRELSCSKSRHAMAYPPIRLEWDPDAWWYKHVPQSDVGEAIIRALQMNADEPMNLADLQEATGEKRTALRPEAERLVKEGRVEQLSSASDGRGSTGYRYKLKRDEDSYGGLSL